MVSPDQNAVKNNTKHLPGQEAFWYVIGGYQLAFAVFFTIYAIHKLENREFYTQNQEVLSQGLGFFNTLVLLTSSWFAAAAIKLFRERRVALAARLLQAAAACGLLFSVIKFFEYEKSISAGYTLLTNDYFTFYYLFTGLHLMHVWIGMGALLIARIYILKKSISQEDVETIEICIVFWHMVDFLWIMIFPLLYLIK